MNLKFIKLFEDYSEGKFRIEDIERCRREGKSIYSKIVKDFPQNDENLPLEVIDIDTDNNEISVMIDNNIYYVDLKNVERIER